MDVWSDIHWLDIRFILQAIRQLIPDILRTRGIIHHFRQDLFHQPELLIQLPFIPEAIQPIQVTIHSFRGELTSPKLHRAIPEAIHPTPDTIPCFRLQIPLLLQQPLLLFLPLDLLFRMNPVRRRSRLWSPLRLCRIPVAVRTPSSGQTPNQLFPTFPTSAPLPPLSSPSFNSLERETNTSNQIHCNLFHRFCI